MIWIPALTTTGLLGLALWLGRNLISTRLAKTVQHEFDEKLEVLRSEFRNKEEFLKADLRFKEAEISALRTGAMTAMASRQAALDKRRLEAVDQLWAAFTALAPARNTSALMARIKFDVAAEHAAKDPKTRKAFETMSKIYDPAKLERADASQARPFVSSTAWALFAAYQSIALSSVMQLQILKSGLGSELIDKDALSKLIKTALPHHSEFVDKFGLGGYHWLLEELEEKLLAEIRMMLSGVEADKESIQQAAELLKLSSAHYEGIKKSLDSKY